MSAFVFLLVLLSRYSSSLHLLPAMLFVIVYLLLCFLFYWSDLECIWVLELIFFFFFFFQTLGPELQPQQNVCLVCLREEWHCLICASNVTWWWLFSKDYSSSHSDSTVLWHALSPSIPILYHSFSSSRRHPVTAQSWCKSLLVS